ncbi:hypothetical protein ACKWTF_012198 [Chironomus riparius]
MAQKFSNCLYRSENSAFDLCDHEIRGIYRMNNTDVFIQPLPERFGIGSHILIEKDIKDSMFEPQDKFLLPDNAKELIKKRIKRSPLIKYPSSKFYQSSTSKLPVPQTLHVETAIFVDKDLFRHMVKNFPTNTEQHLIRFILAMINGVQLLYHHPSLGYKVNFVLKRIEILHNEMNDLRRSSDIDIYLNSFCLWQKKLNPVSDKDVLHFDHALILTGLDLYVVSKNGKVSSQVVGLAPVSGMCTQVSSCTINEGKHFESVFVVAHEIGHNLGMRHDSLDNGCDPSSFIMSPTLGSGKITWSLCSKQYLDAFLNNQQATCLFDRGNFRTNLDHSAEGILPGERFDSDQQCMLKYGKESIRSKNQNIGEICRDLHCQRDRYTWTSHPALEGTNCGDYMWCRSGVCTSKSNAISENSHISNKHLLNSLKTVEKSSLIEQKKFSSLIQEPTLLYTNNGINKNIPVKAAAQWTNFGNSSECESGCLYGESGRLKEGSVGLKIYTRTCLETKSNKKCIGLDRKYETCNAKQCYSIPKLTIIEFANQICDRAKEFDKDLIGGGLQQIGKTPSDSCKVFCKTKDGTKSRSWIFPDGTICHNENSDIDDSYYCVNGNCEKFTCKNSTENYYRLEPTFCPESLIIENNDKSSNRNILQENARDFNRYDELHYDNSTEISEDLTETNELAEPEKLVSSTVTSSESSTKLQLTTVTSTKINTTENRQPITSTTARVPSILKSTQNYSEQSIYVPNWRVRHNSDLQYSPSSSHQTSDYFSSTGPTAMIMMRDRWRNKSGCFFSCVQYSKGLQTVVSKYDYTSNIRLCESSNIPCDKIITTYEYSTNLCMKYQMKVRGLSGRGMQIGPNLEDPDRSCRIACQDKYIAHRFYLVNGEHGYFPFGTNCSFRPGEDKRYCVNGKCIKFGTDGTPSSGIFFNNFNSPRLKRSISSNNRPKRYFVMYNNQNYSENVSHDYLRNLIKSINLRYKNFNEIDLSAEHIDLNRPIDVY